MINKLNGVLINISNAITRSINTLVGKYFLYTDATILCTVDKCNFLLIPSHTLHMLWFFAPSKGHSLIKSE